VAEEESSAGDSLAVIAGFFKQITTSGKLWKNVEVTERNAFIPEMGHDCRDGPLPRIAE